MECGGKGPISTRRQVLLLEETVQPEPEDVVTSDVIESNMIASRKMLTSTPSSTERPPWTGNFTKKDDSEVLEGDEVTKYRSIVGRLMYMAGERPDAQYAIQCLARHMAKPTKHALKNAWRTCSYHVWNKWVWSEARGTQERPIDDGLPRK